MYNLLDVAVSPLTSIFSLVGEFVYLFFAIGFILIIAVMIVFLTINKRRNDKIKKDENLDNKEDENV